MKKIALYLLSFILLFACHNSKLHNKLQQADRFLTQNSIEKAYETLDSIDPESIDDNGIAANYWLLKSEAELRLNLSKEQIPHLISSYKYFGYHLQLEKMMRCYLCLFKIYAHKQQIMDAYVWARLMAFNFDKYHYTKNLKGQFNLQMASLYHEQQRNDTALHYARQALADFYADGNQRDVQLTRIMLFMAYAEKQQTDSANYYMKRAIMRMNDIDEHERAPFYAALGGWTSRTDTTLAKHYLMQSLAITPNYKAYHNLATLYAYTGQQQLAMDMWKRAATTKDKTLRMDALQQLYNLQHNTTNYEAACQTAMQMVTLKDSLSYNNSNIDSIKQEYDASISDFTHNATLYLILFAVVAFAIIITILLFIVGRNNRQTRKKLWATIEEANRMRTILATTRQTVKTPKEKKANDKPTTPQQDIATFNGKLLIDNICEGRTTVTWTRNDFDDAAKYCYTLNIDTINSLRVHKPALSSRYIVFAYLAHIGMSDEQLRHVMVISQSTIRSYRSRIK